MVVIVLLRLRKNRFAAFVFLCAFVLCAGAARASFFDKLEWKTEKHFGKATREQIRDEYGFVVNPLLQGYLDGMGASLTSVSHRTDIPYEFYIVDSSEVNAFAAPGGYLFVTRGLLEEIGSDDELAAVMGHETGHVAAHHGAKRIKQLPLLIVGMNLLYSQGGETAARIGGMALSLMQLHYSREDEYQADQLGVQYTYNAGYDPRAMVSFFQKLESKNRTGDLNKLEVSLMSHPKTTSRMARIQSFPELAPGSPDVLVRIGDSYRERYYYNAAAAVYALALAAAPDNTAALSGLGLSQLELGQYDTARASLERVAQLAPDNQAASNALLRLDAVLAGAGDSPAPAAADPQRAAAAHDKLAAAVMSLEDHIATLRGIQKQTLDHAQNINNEFDHSLSEFAATASSVSEYDTERFPVLQGVAYMFSGLFTALAEAGVMSEETVLLAEEGLKRGRIALFRLDRGPVTEGMAASAEQLAAALADYDNALPQIRTSINDALDASEKLYRDSALIMNELRESLNEKDDSMISIQARLMSDSVETASDSLTALEASVDAAAAQLEGRTVSLRRAALNLNTLTLSNNEERIFRKMFARRFRVDADTLERMLGAGNGYGDILVLQSRSLLRGETLNPGDAAGLDALLSAVPESTAGEDILLTFAEMDLRELVNDRPGVRLQAPARIARVEDVALPPGETLAADPKLEAALRLTMEGNPGEAIRTLNQRGGEKSATAGSHKALGLAYAAAGQYDEAKEEFKNASKKWSEDAQAHYLWADMFRELERYEDALNEYNSALKLNPEYGDAYMGAAFAHAMLGDAAAAETALHDALARGADDATAHRNLGLLYYDQGRWYEAMAEFDASLAANADQPELITLTARLRH